MNHEREDFRTKYTKLNPISKMLIEGFFEAVGKVVPHLDANQFAFEVGCGEGFSTERIRKMIPCRFSAGELIPEQVQEAQNRNSKVEIIQADIYGLPFSDKQIDLAFVLEVLEHLEQPEEALRELKRCSKKAVLSVPREPLWCALNFMRGKYLSQWGNTPGHIQNWSRHKFISLVSNYGKVVKVESPIPWTILLVEF